MDEGLHLGACVGAHIGDLGHAQLAPDHHTVHPQRPGELGALMQSRSTLS